jgi:hypothetical protein
MSYNEKEMTSITDDRINYNIFDDKNTALCLRHSIRYDMN